jgi:hypothetical protein
VAEFELFPSPSDDIDTSDCFIDIGDRRLMSHRDLLLVKHMLERMVAQKARVTTLELPAVAMVRERSPVPHHWRFTTRPPHIVTVPHQHLRVR